MSTKLVNPSHLYDGSPIGMSRAKVDLASRDTLIDIEALAKLREHA